MGGKINVYFAGAGEQKCKFLLSAEMHLLRFFVPQSKWQTPETAQYELFVKNVPHIYYNAASLQTVALVHSLEVTQLLKLTGQA